MLALVVTCCFFVAAALVIVVLVANGRRGGARLTGGGGARLTVGGDGSDTSNGDVDGSDLPALNPSTAFVKTAVGLSCKSGPCRFGLYSITRGNTTITLSDHLAGAVFKVTHAGTEFVNPVAIVGASMQSSVFLDGKHEWNPTEAGSGQLDSFTGKSSSKLLELRGTKTAVYTRTRMAYFNPPGSATKGIVTANKTVLSDTIVSKRIEFIDSSTVDYSVSMLFESGHYFGLLEIWAVWCPRAASATMQALSGGTWTDMPERLQLYFFTEYDGLVMGTASGDAAMGVRLLSYPTGARWQPARFANPESSGVWRKWSITQAINATKDQSYSLPRGPWVWRARMFFGTLAEVKARMIKAT